MPPIDEPICSSPIGPRLAAAMAKLAETIAKYYPDSTSYTPPPPNESMDTLADAMAKLEIASKRLATSTAYLISITAKTTTLNYTTMRTESKDDTINNTHRSTAIDCEATTCKNDTKMIKCLSPVEMKQIRVENFCLKNLFNYFAGHRCKPPAIVFLQTELEPPWKPHDTRYNAMSLDDKTRF
nr:hypothetical protein [Tanacetum cinerariifolium]